MMKNGYISDDLINKNFISRITNNDVKLTIFMDCCHSGTVMDLQYHYVREWKCVNNKKALGKIVFLVVVIVNKVRNITKMVDGGAMTYILKLSKKILVYENYYFSLKIDFNHLVKLHN